MHSGLKVLAGALAFCATAGARAADAPPATATALTAAAVRENGGEGGFARWGSQVCPLVSGLPQSEGEFILERLSETARDAGVPLAAESCNPNLYILVTSSPKQLLEAMDKRNRAFTFSCGVKVPGRGASPSEIDEVIQKPRAVRIWYNTRETVQDGPPVCTDRSAVEVRNGWSSRLQYNVHWSLYTVFVVIDATRLNGVSRGQLADYVSLIGLARLNPDSRLNDAQTVLRLFSSAPSNAPAGLTVWDRAFLKALYSSKQNPNQREQLLKGIAAEVARR
jgi:hypothetical protein